MFPVTDSSQTIVDCLLNAARAAGVVLRTKCAMERATKKTGGGFELTVSNYGGADLPVGQDAQQRVPTTLVCDKLLLATGGCRTPALGQLAVSLGHTLEPPVPSLFTFHIETPWLRQLAGISLENAEVSVAGSKLHERGALLVTHWGLSGPAVLRLSAWGARELHGMNYHFPLRVNWLPDWTEEKLAAEFQARRNSQGAKLIVNSPIAPLPTRLWEQLVLAAEVPADTRWSAFPRPLQIKFIQQLLRTEFSVTGKSLNKDEFVTCGGVKLGEVNFKTMESRICPGLFFAGELLDIDGITGGFNFQAAWTTGWIAGRAMARKS
jgi:predicted Rossmann fold flavoprotein